MIPGAPWIVDTGKHEASATYLRPAATEKRKA
jgi:hypothetical protein